MANHINRSKNPEATVKTTIQSRDTEPIQVCVMRIPVPGSSGEGEPMIAERHTLSDEEIAGFKHLHDQIASLEEFPIGADPFYDLAVHLSRIFSESIEEGCDYE